MEAPAAYASNTAQQHWAIVEATDYVHMAKPSVDTRYCRANTKHQPRLGLGDGGSKFGHAGNKVYGSNSPISAAMVSNRLAHFLGLRRAANLLHWRDSDSP